MAESRGADSSAQARENGHQEWDADELELRQPSPRSRHRCNTRRHFSLIGEGVNPELIENTWNQLKSVFYQSSGETRN